MRRYVALFMLAMVVACSDAPTSPTPTGLRCSLRYTQAYRFPGGIVANVGATVEFDPCPAPPYVDTWTTVVDGVTVTYAVVWLAGVTS